MTILEYEEFSKALLSFSNNTGAPLDELPQTGIKISSGNSTGTWGGHDCLVFGWSPPLESILPQELKPVKTVPKPVKTEPKPEPILPYRRRLEV